MILSLLGSEFRPSKSSRLVFSLLATLLATGTAACGKKGAGGFVSNAQFSTVEEAGDLYGNLNVLLNTGNVMLPAFDLPILNPKNPGALYGSISMRDALAQGTQLGIRVNLSEISGLDGMDGSLLPNGRAIPVVLGDGARPLSVAVKGNSRVYVAFSDSTALIGGAVVINEFDKIGSSVGPIDVFFPFQGENGIKGAAGLFSSTQPGQSGVAVFVDVASVLRNIPQKSMGRELAMAAKSSRAAPRAAFVSQQSMNGMQAYRLNQVLNRMSGKRLRLQ